MNTTVSSNNYVNEPLAYCRMRPRRNENYHDVDVHQMDDVTYCLCCLIFQSQIAIRDFN